MDSLRLYKMAASSEKHTGAENYNNEGDTNYLPRIEECIYTKCYWYELFLCKLLVAYALQVILEYEHYIIAHIFLLGSLYMAIVYAILIQLNKILFHYISTGI